MYVETYNKDYNYGMDVASDNKEYNYRICVYVGCTL